MKGTTEQTLLNTYFHLRDYIIEDLCADLAKRKNLSGNTLHESRLNLKTAHT